ncbi:MAG TPA: hypothetical protein VF101_00205, partial [Gaiellaceae bacterium]
RGDARGNGQLLAASVDARRVIRLTNDVPRDPFSHFSNTSPAWSPDGTKVAFLSNRDGRSDHELFVVGTDGRGDRRLTHGLFVTPPLRWSSDSRRIAFVGWGDPYLGVVGAGGSPVSRLARQPSDGYGYLAPFDFSWVGRPVTPGRLPQPRSAAPHRIRAVRDHAPIGSARVGERRRIARLALWSRLADLSPDGSLVSFVHTRGGHGFEVGVRSIVTGVSRIVVRSEALWPYDEEGIFSRDGRELLFRRWDRLMAFDLSSGRTRTLAVRVPQRPYFALDGRSVAYVSSGGRVAVVEPGRTPHPIAVRLHPDAAYAPSPDGARVLYESAGRTWLLDRKNGRRRVIAVGLPPQLGSWSPDGRRFALAGTFPGCGAPDTILFDRDGRRLGNLLGLRVDGTEGASMRWSTDGRRLIVLPFYGGTRPPPQPLFSYSRATGRASLVLVGAQTPLVGPGGWTVFTRGNALWLGRISGR